MAGHSERQWQGKFFRCGMRCFYCYKPLVIGPHTPCVSIGISVEEATKDHLTPTARGGRDSIDNIVPACIACNQRKGVMTEQEFRTTFSKAFKALTGSAPTTQTNLSMIDQPSVQHLRKESEATSWAWRNPSC